MEGRTGDKIVCASIIKEGFHFFLSQSSLSKITKQSPLLAFMVTLEVSFFKFPRALFSSFVMAFWFGS